MTPTTAFAGAALATSVLGALCHPARRGAGRALAQPPPAPGAPAPPWVQHALAVLKLSVPATSAWVIARAAAALAVATAAAVGAPVLAAVLAIGALGAPAVLPPFLERRWLQERDAQLPAALEHLAAELRAGNALAPALVELGSVIPDPLGTELRAVAMALQCGAGTGAALDGWARRPGSSADVRLVAAALELGAAAGGEVARSVDRVAATLRERRQLRAEAHALATQARASAAVLAIAPVGFTVLVAGVEPGTVHFLSASPVGVACLTMGLALEVAGAVWMRRIVRGAA